MKDEIRSMGQVGTLYVMEDATDILPMWAADMDFAIASVIKLH